MKKKMPVKDLQFGMYVYELDRPWTETPFVFQGFEIKTQQQLDAIGQHCEHVFVDTVRGEREEEVTLAPGSGPIATDLKGTGKVVHIERATVESGLGNATEVHAAPEFTVQRAFDAVRGEKALDSVELKLAVGNMTESMLRNPDAMILFTALQERGGYQLTRAVNVSTY